MNMNKLTKLALLATSLLTLVGCDKTSSNVEKSSNSDSVNTTLTDSTSTVTVDSGKKDEGEKTTTSSTINEEENQIAYTFNWNYEGASEASVVNEKQGQILTFPTNVNREGYLFSYWATDENGINAFDISSKATAPTTLYAIWVSSTDAVTITFHSNDSVYIEMSVKSGSRLKSFPAVAVRQGEQYLKNWYTTSTYEKTASNMTKYSANTDIYARWFKVDTFEAEYTKLTDLTYEEDPNINDFGEKIGHGYSSDVSGTGLIFSDSTIGSTCSNGHFVCDLYYKDAFIQFDVTAEKATTDAILTATLSAEYFDMTFTPSNWIVSVNGESINYDTITLDNVPTGRDSAAKRAFTTHTLSTAVSLKQGKNVIKLITNNSTRHDSTGTMAAEAPMIDCINCYSDAELTFDAHTDNLG